MVGAFGGEMAFIKATSMANTPCGIESECILSVMCWVSSSALAGAGRAAARGLQRQLMMFDHLLAEDSSERRCRPAALLFQHD
jgi:hypothetical protein